MRYLTDAAEQEAIRWMHEAAVFARRALCLRARCGTVIVKDGEIIGAGYNAPPLDRIEDRLCDKQVGPGKPNYDRTCCMHAEWRAILDAMQRYPDKVRGAQLYFVRVDDEGVPTRAGKPFCTVCSRLALDSGIAQFLLWHEAGVGEYPTDEYNHLSYEYVHPAA